MPRFEQYPLAESLPDNAILLLADPNDLVEGNPKVKRFELFSITLDVEQSIQTIEADIQQINGEIQAIQTSTPTIYNIEGVAFGPTILPTNIKSADVINFSGIASSVSIPFFGFDGPAPQEGTIIIMRNERPNTVVTIQHSPNEGTFCVGGTNVVLEGNRLGFVTFYVRRSGTDFSLRQIGGGFY